MATEPALARLLQLASPTLPVGAYAYSQGLEYAVEAGWIADVAGLESWAAGLLRGPLARLDVPLLARFYAAWEVGDADALEYGCALVHATREAAELQAQERHLGLALARLLADLGLEEARAWRTHAQASYLCMFALAAWRWGVALEAAAQGYLWTWCEAQVAAAVKLVPLGQTEGQAVLFRLGGLLPAAAAAGLAVPEEAIGASAPGLAAASALHEAQYSRLFRS